MTPRMCSNTRSSSAGSSAGALSSARVVGRDGVGRRTSTSGIGLLARIAGAADGDLRLGKVRVALIDPLAPACDRLARLLLETVVERVDVSVRKAEPLPHRADEAVDLAVNVGLLVTRVLDRQHQVAT